MLRTLTLALVLLTAAAGCIAAPESVESASTAPPPLPPVQEGRMTQESAMEEGAAELCVDRGISLPNLALQCYVATTTIGGEIDLTELPVELSAGMTDIEVVPGDEGTWSVVQIVRAAGATSEEAEESTEGFELEVSIQDGAGYRLVARSISPEDPPNGVHVLLRATLPPSVLYAMDASTASGDLTVSGFRLQVGEFSAASGDILVEDIEGESLSVEAASGDIVVTAVKADRLEMDAASGDIEFDAEATFAAVSTASGDILGTLRPRASGTFTFDAASGDVDLGLPESSSVGYRLSAETTSGDIEIGLRDGSTSGDEENQSFTTKGFESRSVRTVVEISTTSGDIGVTPTSASDGPL